MIIDKNIAKVLIEDDVLTREQLQKVLEEHYRTKENLTGIIERLGFSTEDEIVKVISKYYEIPYEEINEEYIDRDVISLIKPELARKFKTIPINLIANQLTVAMSDPLNLIALDTLSFTSGKKIKPIVCRENTIERLIDHFFGSQEDVAREFQVKMIPAIIQINDQGKIEKGITGYHDQQSILDWLGKKSIAQDEKLPVQYIFMGLSENIEKTIRLWRESIIFEDPYPEIE